LEAVAVGRLVFGDIWSFQVHFLES
jgi:hypothetical protein